MYVHTLVYYTLSHLFAHLLWVFCTGKRKLRTARHFFLTLLGIFNFVLLTIYVHKINDVNINLFKCKNILVRISLSWTVRFPNIIISRNIQVTVLTLRLWLYFTFAGNSILAFFYFIINFYSMILNRLCQNSK